MYVVDRRVEEAAIHRHPSLVLSMDGAIRTCPHPERTYRTCPCGAWLVRPCQALAIHPRQLSQISLPGGRTGLHLNKVDKNVDKKSRGRGEVGRVVTR